MRPVGTVCVGINVLAGLFNLTLILWFNAGWINGVAAAVAFMAAGFFVAKFTEVA